MTRAGRILLLLLAIGLIAFALWQNRGGYRLLPNLLALVGVGLGLWAYAKRA